MSHPRVLELSTELTQPSPYYLGEEILDLFPQYLARHAFDRLALVTTPPLMARFGRSLLAVLREWDFPVSVILLDEGEGNKSWDTLSTLCERLLDEGVTKESIILSLGGGLVGNVVGLAAGLTYRGVRYVEIPTTMMAQTDGVLSNKQAINGATGKNQFGMYYAPLFIWSDVAYVRHEPYRQIKCAIVEGVKNAFIHNPLVAGEPWLQRLERHLANGEEWIRANLLQFSRELIESKLPILRADPTERKYAVVLEYGHTFGHAIEWLCKPAVPHGEAVSIGMCAAAELSYDLGLCSHDFVELHYHFLGDLLGTPVRNPAEHDAQEVIAAMLADNKRKPGGLHVLLLEDVAHFHNPDGDFMVRVEESDAVRALDHAGAATTLAFPVGA